MSWSAAPLAVAYRPSTMMFWGTVEYSCTVSPAVNGKTIGRSTVTVHGDAAPATALTVYVEFPPLEPPAAARFRKLPTRGLVARSTTIVCTT